MSGRVWFTCQTVPLDGNRNRSHRVPSLEPAAVVITAPHIVVLKALMCQ